MSSAHFWASILIEKTSMFLRQGTLALANPLFIDFKHQWGVLYFGITGSEVQAGDCSASCKCKCTALLSSLKVQYQLCSMNRVVCQSMEYEGYQLSGRGPFHGRLDNGSKTRDWKHVIKRIVRLMTLPFYNKWWNKVWANKFGRHNFKILSHLSSVNWDYQTFITCCPSRYNNM